MSEGAPHRSFLVTCVGAYDDSGLGTGGFVCLHEGSAVVLDKIDSTGLCAHRGVIYRFARGLRAILGYSVDGLCSMLKIPDARDVHDIAVRDGQFVCASTGTNEVLWINPLKGVVRRWQAEGERDAWHLNCFCEVDGRLHISAFGRFTTHRGWLEQCGGTGFVLDLENGREVLSGLNGPHNPRFIDGEWIVCDSHAGALVLQRPGDTARRVALGGFTRGLDHDARHLYVGESANRKAPIPADHSAIAVIDRQTHEVLERIPVPFPEIYEVLKIEPELAAAMVADPAKFQLDQSSERLAALENQVALGWREIHGLKRRLADLRRWEQCRAGLLTIKRRLVG